MSQHLDDEVVSDPFAQLHLDIAHATEADFLGAWEARYDYGSEHLYDNNIGKKLTEERLWELFTWKNGGAISAKKQTSIRRNYLGGVPDNPAGVVLDPSHPGGPIWNIYFLHCIDPETWPIYDQHAHRAMVWMLEHRIDELPTTNTKTAKRTVYDSYRDRYRPFIRNYFAERDQRRIDKALFAFGRFLKVVAPYVG